MPATAKARQDSALLPSSRPSVGPLFPPKFQGSVGGLGLRGLRPPIPRKGPQSDRLRGERSDLSGHRTLDHRLQVKERARVALDNSGRSRAEIADELTELLGYSFSETRLEKAVKDSSPNNGISLGQAAAFATATGTVSVFEPALEALGMECVPRDVAEAGRLAVSLAKVLKGLGRVA